MGLTRVANVRSGAGCRGIVSVLLGWRMEKDLCCTKVRYRFGRNYNTRLKHYLKGQTFLIFMARVV